MSELHYQRPRPENYEGHRVLHDFVDSETTLVEFLDDRDRILDRYDLDDEMRRLVGDLDYRGLVARGIHAVLVVQFQRLIEWGTNIARAGGEHG